MIGDFGVLDGPDLAASEQRETRIGTADVGEQDSINPGHCLSAIKTGRWAPINRSKG
jgi:hypothetical protein